MADMQKFFEQIQSFDINDVDFDRVGVWPLPGRMFLGLVAAAVIVGGCYFLLIKEKQLTMTTEVAKEERLRKDFADKAHEAANLDAYREQMKIMQDSFGALVSRLPTDTEVPGLLEDIDDKGVESRLVINSIGLQKETVSDVHVELPIHINVTGGFHEFGAFVSGIAGMPRIVTLHDFSMSPTQEGSGLLTMELRAKTYRYKTEE